MTTKNANVLLDKHYSLRISYEEFKNAAWYYYLTIKQQEKVKRDFVQMAIEEGTI